MLYRSRLSQYCYKTGWLPTCRAQVPKIAQLSAGAHHNHPAVAHHHAVIRDVHRHLTHTCMPVVCNVALHAMLPLCVHPPLMHNLGHSYFEICLPPLKGRRHFWWLEPEGCICLQELLGMCGGGKAQLTLTFPVHIRRRL